MKTSRRLFAIVFVSLSGSVGACVHHPATNHRPIIMSLAAVPDSIGQYDSSLVTCSAHDPDGDVLVYDWITDARLRISGTRPNQYWLYNTLSPTRAFYPGTIGSTVLDTGWVQCFARDGRGMSASRTVYIKVHH